MPVAIDPLFSVIAAILIVILLFIIRYARLSQLETRQRHLRRKRLADKNYRATVSAMEEKFNEEDDDDETPTNVGV